MSFKGKIQKQFGSYSLKSPDVKSSHPWHKIHLHADFLELKTLLWAKDSYLTKQDLITHYKDSDQNPMEDGSDFFDSELYASNEIDKWDKTFEEIFDVIEDRSLIFDTDYPFKLDREKICLKQTLSFKQKLYIYLLISSSLNNFSTTQNQLTKDFESLSKFALQEFFQTYNVEEFGQNSIYSGNTRTKIEQLGKILNVDIRPDYISEISKYASKEKGLDIVCWKNFNDKISNMPIVLCQCACGKDWHKKQDEPRIYDRAFLDFNKLKPKYSLLIPYALGKIVSDGKSGIKFHEEANTNGALIFERKRILDSINTSKAEIEGFLSFDVVEHCIKEEYYEV